MHSDDQRPDVFPKYHNLSNRFFIIKGTSHDNYSKCELMFKIITTSKTIENNGHAHHSNHFNYCHLESVLVEKKL